MITRGEIPCRRANPDLVRVSVVLPCRNEALFIRGCLDSILANDYPRDWLEILVVDGMSDDGTREVVEEYGRHQPNVRIFENKECTAAAGLNLAIRAAAGAIIVRMDAHALFPRNYISRLVAWLQATEAENVGGAWVTCPQNSSPMARAIAFALSHPVGVGNAYFRLQVTEPKWVDTVPFGCYRRELFDRIGVFDEDLVRNQDDEFNHRILRSGGRILLVPDVISYYFARDSLRKVWRMYYQYGYFKPLAAWKVGQIMTLRQVVPALFVGALAVTGALALVVSPARIAVAGVAGAYLAAALTSAALAVRRHGARCAAALLLVFPTLHCSYGLGSLTAVLERALGRRRLPHHVASVPLSR